MQNTMVDSTTSCIPSTLNFVCDVDGVHTEIPIPASAWDFENETVWLTQAQLAELYKTSVQNVGQHIGNILEDEELQADSVIKESFITAADGKSYRTKHYNLEMLIALGYRIKSKVATKFRQWATKHLKELMTKGHTEIITQPELTDEEIMSRALEIAHRTLALREERIKALTAERDEAVRTKTQYQSNLAAQMSGRVFSQTCKKVVDAQSHSDYIALIRRIKHITAYVRLAPVSRIGIAIALKGKSFSPIITSSGFGRLFLSTLFLLDRRFEYDYKAKKKRRMDSTSYPPAVIQRWALDDKNNLHNRRLSCRTQC